MDGASSKGASVVGGCQNPGTWVFIPGFATLSDKLGRFLFPYLSPGEQLVKWDRDPCGLLRPKSPWSRKAPSLLSRDVG